MTLPATIKTMTVASLAGLSLAHLSILTPIIPINGRDWLVIANNGGTERWILGLGLAQLLLQMLHGLR